MNEEKKSVHLALLENADNFSIGIKKKQLKKKERKTKLLKPTNVMQTTNTQSAIRAKQLLN